MLCSFVQYEFCCHVFSPLLLVIDCLELTTTSTVKIQTVNLNDIFLLFFYCLIVFHLPFSSLG